MHSGLHCIDRVGLGKSKKSVRGSSNATVDLGAFRFSRSVAIPLWCACFGMGVVSPNGDVTPRTAGLVLTSNSYYSTGCIPNASKWTRIFRLLFVLPSAVSVEDITCPSSCTVLLGTTLLSMANGWPPIESRPYASRGSHEPDGGPVAIAGALRLSRYLRELAAGNFTSNERDYGVIGVAEGVPRECAGSVRITPWSCLDCSRVVHGQ